MNPNNVFGRQQGAFQTPSNVSQSSGLFQSLSQQSGTSPNIGFGQKPPFGQPSAFIQPPVFAQASAQASVFGQTSSFGQSPSFGQSGGLGQSSSFSSTSQAPAFGQPASSQATLGFGAPPPSAAQSQTPAFGQVQAFGQTSGFGQTTSGFGISSSNSQPPSYSISTGGSQPFGQPSAFATTSSAVSGQSNTQTSAFGTKFNFKPPNETVFKPIFSVSPVPPSVQPVPAPEPFGASKPVTGGSDSSSSGGSLFTGVKSSTLGFSFSQPGAVPSASVATSNTSQTSGGTIGANTLQFTFSQPANPSGSSSTVTAAQSTSISSSPSAFSFSAKVVQPQTVFGQPSFAFSSLKPEESSEVRNEESSGDAAFVSLGKGMKRKEEPSDTNASHGKSSKVEEVQGESVGPRHSSKRPLIRSRGAAGGLFMNALSGLMKASVNKKEERTTDRAPLERPDPPVTDVDVPLTPPRPPAPIRQVLEKGEKPASEPEVETGSPSRRAGRGDSTDSLSGLSPSELTAIQCKGIPPKLNRKDLVKKHFGRFGKVHRVYCRPEKNLVIVHFYDHASAALAKKKGKHFQGTEIHIFWQRKKQSPGTKREKPSEAKDVVSAEELSRQEGSVAPLRKPGPRPPAVSTSLVKGSPAKKFSAAKTLQFDSDLQQDVGSECQSIDRPVIIMPSSLQPLIGQIAETAEEKYRLLEQRDKILRQMRSKRTDLDMSKVFVGTCPDMCPEKERYMRETRNQLSVFELVPDTEKVDHPAAIKEYSRSSADQEEPLPHELRPLPVLTMTMHYLVTQIMDQGEGNYRDWYDFVWNRTRGIRKDITQQHLCDPLTVSLIEKCTRFHIHCAHHLCQEPMMSFDAKINNENMTKCLQSLKEMYQDLDSKDVYCQNEAEFRQYNVLLKLNDGDILREVQQFRKEVRDSVEVKFAVQAFAALNSNNFVRFFKLVKAASYLSGCILHRYFNQVRLSALKALNIAYTVGSQRSTTFPLEDLVRMLMFRNASEAMDFLQLYGLNVADGMVELSRTAYQEPDLPIPPKRSVAIEKKKRVLVGEIVNGGPLPNPPQHTPVCSFDSNNKYRGDLASLESLPDALKVKPLVELDPRPQLKPKLLSEPRLFTEPPVAVEVVQQEDTQETGESSQHIVPLPPVNPQLMFQPIAQPIVHPIAQPQPVRPPSPKREPAYSDQELMAEVESVVEEVLTGEVLDIAKAGAQYVSTALSVSTTELQTIVSDVVAQMLREVSTSEILAEKERIAEEKRKLEEDRRRREREAFLDKLSSELCAEISEEVLSQCTREMADIEIKLALEEKAACVAGCTEQVCNSLVEETLAMELDCLVREVVEAHLWQIHKVIKRWRDVVAIRRQLKRQMRGFPAAPCCVDPRFKLKALVPSAPSFPSMDTLARGLINLGNAGNMVVSCTRLLKTRNDTIRKMRVDHYYSLLLSERVWSHLDLTTLVAESTSNPPDRIFWKATLLLPSDQDSNMSSILTKWLKVKLGGGERMEENMAESEGKLKTLVISNSLRDVGQKTHKVHICIKVSQGPLSEEGQIQLEEKNQLLGTRSLLMLLPTLPCIGIDEEDVPLLSALLQLKQVQQASGWDTALPLALLIPDQLEGAVSDQKLEEVLMLKTLVQDGLISEYIFIHLSGSVTDLQGSKQLSEAVRWLIAHSPASTVLSSQPLLQFVEGGLCREFHSRFFHDKQERAQAALPCQEPAVVIQLYNSVLVHLADVVSSKRLVRISWPPSEFSLPENRHIVPHLDWNSPQHLEWLRRAILSLQIPELKCPPENAPWPYLCTSIFEYVSQIPSSAQSQPLLMSHLEHLLARVHAHYLQQVHQDEACEGISFSHIPWDDILILCIEHKLKDWHFPESPVAADAFADKGEIFVYYYKEELKDFPPPVSWVAAVNRTHMEKQQNTVRSNMISTLPLTPAALFPRQRLFESLIEAEEKPSMLDISHTPSPQELLPQRLLSGIQQEKAQSQRFEEQLQRWLALEPLDSATTPLFVPSTLLSMPEILIPIQRPSASAACSIQELETEDPSEVPCTYSKRGTLSLTQRLKELDRLVLANREEELACSLKLNSLLDIIED
ncbi:germinal-center associated nuclear protein [Tachysurus vachellii]|uniref:germinal-center associated nuclear protein n=1 Tax=Tachysurus vachellii TaxID=175792 RepID=UPI00296AD572|nr:germinal-center associated nuclear protein [Tachysurus vachellii]XP_060732790.1 germinal-center associated nuclear protein [Tachysurus vachellii]